MLEYKIQHLLSFAQAQLYPQSKKYHKSFILSFLRLPICSEHHQLLIIQMFDPIFSTALPQFLGCLICGTSCTAAGFKPA